MRRRNWGRIVFVSSESAVNIPAEMIHYGMTKAAQLAVTRGPDHGTGASAALPERHEGGRAQAGGGSPGTSDDMCIRYRQSI